MQHSGAGHAVQALERTAEQLEEEEAFPVAALRLPRLLVRCRVLEGAEGIKLPSVHNEAPEKLSL